MTAEFCCAGSGCGNYLLQSPTSAVILCSYLLYRPEVQLGTSHKTNALLTHFNGSWSICVVLDSICWKASCGAWQRVFYHFLGDASAGFIALGLPFCFALARG